MLGRAIYETGKVRRVSPWAMEGSDFAGDRTEQSIDIGAQQLRGDQHDNGNDGDDQTIFGGCNAALRTQP
jgi:hypothetical protein